MNEKFFDLGKEKQDRMINAALKVFAENPYRHASTDTIVQNAGISKGLLFHYFGSKIGLYTFLFDYSVKYMLFEYDHAIPKDEKDYFAIRKDMEKAKLNVLRNYPYMAQFILSALSETSLDVVSKIEDEKNNYLNSMSAYCNNCSLTDLLPSVTREKIDALIRYTVEGLTADQMKTNSFQPEILYKEICNFIDTIKIMSIQK